MGLATIRLEMFESILVNFFRILATWESYVYTKGYTRTQTLTHTHIYTHIHTARDRSDDYSQNLQSRFAYKALFPII